MFNNSNLNFEITWILCFNIELYSFIFALFHLRGQGEHRHRNQWNWMIFWTIVRLRDFIKVEELENPAFLLQPWRYL